MVCQVIVLMCCLGFFLGASCKKVLATELFREWTVEGSSLVPKLNDVKAHIKDLDAYFDNFKGRNHSLLGFVLTVDQTQPRSVQSIQLLRSLGFNIIPVKPPILNHFIHTGVCSNKFGHLAALQYYAFMKSPPSYAWFFEDDIKLVPTLSQTQAREILAQVLSKDQQPTGGIIYLGACAVWSDSGHPYLETPDVRYSQGSFTCAHAYGMTHLQAQTIVTELTKDVKESCTDTSGPELYTYFDQLLSRFGREHVPSIVIGSNFVSPHENDHRGIFYQDRKSFPSNIQNVHF